MLTRIRFFGDGSHSAHSYEDHCWPSACEADDFMVDVVGIQVWLVNPLDWDRVLLFSEGKTDDSS